MTDQPPGVTAISVRNATVADVEKLTRLGRRTFEDTFGPDNDAENMRLYADTAFTVERIRAELQDPANTFLLACSNNADEPVGYAKLCRSTSEESVEGSAPVELQRIYVDSAAQGTGAGALLMQRCIEIATFEGFSTLWLGVWEHNPKAIGFYRRWGFEPVGSHVFQLGTDPQTDIVMERALGR